LDVSWTVGTGRHAFSLTVDAPRGTSGAISVPTNGKRVQVRVDGHLVWDGSHGNGAQLDGTYVSMNVNSGHHAVTVSTIGH